MPTAKKRRLKDVKKKVKKQSAGKVLIKSSPPKSTVVKPTAKPKITKQLKTPKKPDKDKSPEGKMSRVFKKQNDRTVKKGARKSESPTPQFIKMVVHIIHQGNVPETACRALGIMKPQFQTWVQKGFEDIGLGVKTEFNKFVAAVDMAMAQEEAKSVSKINRGVLGWQAIAWGLERKAFQRWGNKQVQIQGTFEDLKKVSDGGIVYVAPDKAGEIAAVLEESGYLRIQGGPEDPGEVIDITGKEVQPETIEVESLPTEAPVFDSEEPEEDE